MFPTLDLSTIQSFSFDLDARWSHKHYLLHSSTFNHTNYFALTTNYIHHNAWCESITRISRSEPCSPADTMAYDSYRNPAEQAPPYYDYPDSRSQYANPYIPAEAYKPKSRQSSRDRGEGRATEYARFSQPHQPINEAVNAAFVDKAADPTAGMNPELIAHITETVIKQLRTTSLDAGTPVQATHQTYPPPPPPQLPAFSQQPAPQSPTMQSSTSPPIPTRNVYTPPSPPKYSDYPNTSSPPLASAIPQVSPPSPPEPSNSQFDPRRPPSRTSVTNEPTNVRPKGPTRLSTSKEETTLEKIWGQLFDEDGQPTPRLGQLLRGLAVHLVREPRFKSQIAQTVVLIKEYRLRTMNRVKALS